MRPRNTVDSAQAQINHFWYNPGDQGFDSQFQKLKQIPPITTDMPYDVMMSYIAIDSFARTEFFNDIPLNRWLDEGKSNDTIKSVVKYLYLINNYDPVRLCQYMNNTSRKTYLTNIQYLINTENTLLERVLKNSPDKLALNDLNIAHYYLRIKINKIDKAPWKNHENEFFYSVNADVIDTLKGKVFKHCTDNLSFSSDANSNSHKSSICFHYVSGQYSLDGNRIIDPSLLDESGNLTLRPGQELIVSLMYGNYKWDYEHDYFGLMLLTAFPIMNEKVYDPGHEWSKDSVTDYQKWKNIFNNKVAQLLSGGY